MKKKILFPALSLCIAIFLFGPIIGQRVYKWITPAETITLWKDEATKLDISIERSLPNETRRLELLHKLAQRGIHFDGGIRDEAIEHSVSPYAIAVMACWRWKDFLGMHGN